MTRRLLVGYLTVTVLVLLLLEVPLGIVYGARERDRFSADVERDARVIATIYEDVVEQGTVPDPTPASNYEARTGARVVVVDRAGISLVDSELGVPRDFSTRPEIALALTGVRAAGTRYSETVGGDLLYVAVPIASGGVVHGALRITLDATAVDDRVHGFWLGLVGVGIVVLGVMALVGWAIARSVSRPVRDLHRLATRFAHGDLSAPTTGSAGPPEIRALGETMSTMAARLDALITEQRAFVADASHQLRTPLTALRLRLENVQSRLAPNTRSGDGLPADVATARDDVDRTADDLADAIDETNRLGSLVTDLLRLARADEHPPSQPVDLLTEARDRADTWSAVAEARSIALRLELPANVDGGSQAVTLMVLAVPGAVEQVLDNVLDNAIDHSPDGGTVTITVRRSSGDRAVPGADGVASVTIADEGHGLSADERDLATRRFWRGSGTRPGTGLGLAIARSLAEASGGSLRLDAALGGGLAVTLELPLAPTGAR